jgi:NAD(P)-dependent dehydrogenase (short-subunit alcohol dehydrogenase family)
MRLKSIKKQVVVMVGASSGIGRETALRFAERGAKMVLSARGAQGLNSLVDEIRRRGGEALAVGADVSEFSQVKSIADRTVERYGRIDTWVHLAAVSLYATFEQTTPEEFKRIIEVNLLGQVYGAMAALPHLRREGRGALVHVSSVEAKVSFPLQSAYAASKHGINGFLKSLRLELEHEKVPVSVTEVMPAGINTPFFNKARTKIGVKPMPVPPIYQPSLVADAILYAAEHPIPEVIVGGAAKAAVLTQRVAPAVTNALLRRTGFTSQRTNEPKSEDAPDNLFEPLEGYDRAEGDFSDQATSHSLYPGLQTHPMLRRVIGVAALGALTLAAVRAFGNAGQNE